MYWNHLYNLMFSAFLFNSCHKFCNSSPSTAEHLSSRLPSVLPFCSAQGLSGICFVPLVSSLLSRGTCWMQQHTGLTSFPWCHHHVALLLILMNKSRLPEVFPPPQSFTTYHPGHNQEELVQLCHEAMLGEKDNYFGTFSLLPAASHLPWS